MGRGRIITIDSMEISEPASSVPVAESFPLFFFSSRRRHTRWTGDWSSDVCSSDLGHVPAMTLDDVVVFQERRAALEDPKLWAHELKHVIQFAEWGVDEIGRASCRERVIIWVGVASSQ